MITLRQHRSLFPASSQSRRGLSPAMPAVLVEPLENRRLLSATLAGLPLAEQQAISTAIGQVAKLTSADGATDDGFGQSVAVSGNTVVIGSYNKVMTGAGAAYVFTEPAAGWGNMTQVAKLTAAGGAAFDGFGSAVTIAGNTVVVGAPNATINGNVDQGAAYVFTEPATGWGNMTQTAKLTAADGAEYDAFGHAVSISGNTVVVGATGATINGNGAQGAVYLFTAPGAGWTTMNQTAKLYATDGAASDELGGAVAISGDTVVAGAGNAEVGNNYSQGAAYVFVRPASGWAGNLPQTAKLTAADGAEDDSLGNAVAISGNTVVVGASFAVIGNNTYQGAAYVFTAPAAGWTNMTQTAKLLASDGAQFGYFGTSVAISGNTLVIGAVPLAGGAGKAYLFTEPSAGWTNMTETSKLSPADGSAVADFGSAVAISGGTVVIGSAGAIIGTHPLQGAAYVFTFTPVLATPAFSNLTPSSSILQGTTVAANFAGTIAAATLIPSSGEFVAVTVDGVTQDAAINSQGGFSTTFNTTNFPVSTTPYQVTYAYAGDANLNSITDDTTTKLTVIGLLPMFRLYSPVTLEHLYTTDANEYNTLKQYARIWNAEGQVFSMYSGPATVSGVADEPLYRLYDAPLKQHFWTDNYNEYNTLRNAPWNWNDEGIAGYVFPTAVAASEPLYRLMAPQVHLWTTDVNEYNTLASEGWTQEGIIGYVL